MFVASRFIVPYVLLSTICLNNSVFGQEDAQAVIGLRARLLVELDVDAKKVANENFLEAVRTREQTFLMRVCELDAQQKEQVEQLGKGLRQESLKALDQENVNRFDGNGRLLLQRQVKIRVGDDQVIVNRQAIDTYRNKLHEKFKSVLKPEQQEKFTYELKARDEFSRRANAELLVTILDQKLSLKPEQIEPLRQSLAGWTEADELHLTQYLQQNAENWIPPIPAKYLADHLTTEQQNTYQAAEHVAFRKSQLFEVEER